jgi:Galactose oxidase, central domain
MRTGTSAADLERINRKHLHQVFRLRAEPKKEVIMKRTIAAWSSLLLLGAFVQFAVAQNWTPNGPLPREGHSAVFDPSTRQMIIFGGNSSEGYTQEEGNTDVWRLLPSAALAGVQNWVASHPTGTPPTGRWGHLAVYDPASNRMIVFAGTNAALFFNDVWGLTNANGNGGPSAWLQQGVAGEPPYPRAFVAGAYDPGSNTLMVYGGSTDPSVPCGPSLADYWVLSHANGLGGTPTWTSLSPLGGGPGPRCGQSAVYDSATNELIVFGGGNSQGAVFNDVWILKNANGTAGTPAWQELFPTGGPPGARVLSSATYDPVSNVMTIFGGALGSEGGSTNDTWFLSNANGAGGTPAWSTFTQSRTDDPQFRDSHTAVYDASRNVMIIYGGETQLIDWVLGDVFFLSHANGK